MSPSPTPPRPLLCDAQVHAPDLPHIGIVGGIDGDPLLAEMDRALVDRCFLVPLERPGSDEMASNPAALELAAAHPNRFAVMGAFELHRPDNVRLLPHWLRPGMVGIRLAFVREPNRSLLERDEADWFWEAAEACQIPLMVLVPGMLTKVRRVALRHPNLRLIVDHLALPPHVVFDDLVPEIRPLADLADLENVAVKASALPCSVSESFPFPTIARAMSDVLAWFGPSRVFWGSDLTRLPCSYRDVVRFFVDEVAYRDPGERDLVLGQGLLRWIGWDA
jgi:L-fuconolactonase